MCHCRQTKTYKYFGMIPSNCALPKLLFNNWRQIK